MSDFNIILPSQPKAVLDEEFRGVFEIDGLYPGYGHTLGNSLRRIILSSLPGAAITGIKIDGASHEFSTLEGVKEDVVAIILNLKRVRLAVATDEPQTVTLNVKGAKKVTAGDLETPGQVTILNPDLHIAEITDKKTSLKIEMTVEKGLGYMPKEVLEKERVDIGTIVPDAAFTPIRRVNYEVENMRVGDRTDFNRLRIYIETDSTLTARDALERSITIMIEQLKAIIGFQEDVENAERETEDTGIKERSIAEKVSDVREELDKEFLKTRIESLPGLSARTINALNNANIRTAGGLVRKKVDDLLSLEGVGDKAIQEIQEMLSKYGVTLK
jgi:DNA-directed RNA polymerase subunit alpha